MGLAKKRVLITCGPTWIPIDQVRVISNRSTGQLGHLIAQGCCQAGARVTLLEGPVEKPLKSQKIRVVKFQFFDEFSRKLKTELKGSYSAIIHAAAVADYRLAKVARGKIPSEKYRFSITLIPTEKLINSIKRLSPKSVLVGFKLEDRENKTWLQSQTKKLLANSGCDIVVANTLTNHYRAFIFNKHARILAKADSRGTLAKKLINVLKHML
jgi:phosphopantothenoylcysteine decarboxylase / phosphopantothenate---cysteine ligase